MEQHALRSVNNCLNTNIYSYLETSGGQSSILYLHAVHFFNTSLIRHLWQLKTVVFLNWCLMCALLLHLPTSGCVFTNTPTNFLSKFCPIMCDLLTLLEFTVLKVKAPPSQCGS